MTTSVFSFAATVPAGTSIAAPHTVALTMPAVIIDIVRWRVPPGPRGHLGWFLSMGGVQVIPEAAGSYVIADNESDDWTVSDLPDSGAWQLTGYNTGTFDHTVYLYFHVTPIALAGVTGGNVQDGFPVTQADIPTMWLT